AIAERGQKTDLVPVFALDVVNRVFPVEHEKRHVHAGQHVWPELRELGVLERQHRVALPTPEHEVRQAALELRIPIERPSAGIECGLVTDGRPKATLWHVGSGTSR